MKRRQFLELLGVTAIGASVQGCDRRNQAEGAFQLPISVPPFSKQRLHRLLGELQEAYEEKDLHVSNSLLPPVSESELQARCDWFEGKFPPELVALYSWRGGQHSGPWDLADDDYPFWFRDCAFSSIDTAKIEYRRIMDSYGIDPESYDLLKHCFPFAEFNGGWMVMPTEPQRLDVRFPRPVISVMEGIDVFFYSVESMVETCIDWVREPSYDRNSGLTDEVELEIWRRHNPGIFEI